MTPDIKFDYNPWDVSQTSQMDSPDTVAPLLPSVVGPYSWISWGLCIENAAGTVACTVCIPYGHETPAPVPVSGDDLEP